MKKSERMDKNLKEFSRGKNESPKVSKVNATRNDKIKGFLSTYSPNINSFGIMSSAQKQFRSAVPKRHHHGIQIR